MSKVFLLTFLVFYACCRCNSKQWRSFTVIQKSVGITVHHPNSDTSQTTSTTGPWHGPNMVPTSNVEANNETETNATKMIENVLNTVVQSSMNDMLLKLTNSLSDLFSMFSAGRHQRKQMKDEIEARLSSANAIESLKFDSSITSNFDTNSEEKTYDETTHRNNADNDDLNLNFDSKTDVDNKKWWRNILMKILNKNKQQQSSTDSPTTVGYQWLSSTIKEIDLDIQNGLSSNYFLDNVSNQLSDLKSESESNLVNVTEEFQISHTHLETENDSQAIDEITTTSASASTNLATERLSVAPYWELLIRLDNRLEGVLKNQSVVVISSTTTVAPEEPEDQQVTVSSILSLPDAVVSNTNNLITGDPDAVVSATKKITPLPNRPSNKSKNLFMQTVLVSCAAVFAIFVFSCLGIALVCFSKKRNTHQRRLGVLPRFDPTTGAGIFGRPIFKTSSTAAPYYYDSSARSDWSLMSRDRDRQVETYFATASILDTSCDSSPSTNSHPVSIPPDAAIMH